MVDRHFAEPRLAGIYDALDADRSDLLVYEELVAGFGAGSVLDVGCGTAAFAVILARRGLAVTGVDPAAASLDVARRKPGAAHVRWIHGNATALPPLQVDVATMTGNVAQAIAEPVDWTGTLRGVHSALRPDGLLVVETRDPAHRARGAWNPTATRTTRDIPGVGLVETWVEVTQVDGPLVSFRSTFVFVADGQVMTSDSTLRSRQRAEMVEGLQSHGYIVEEVRDGPDRPTREMVFLARRGDPTEQSS